MDSLGLSSACQVHEYHGTFQGHSAKFKMTSVCGHVMSLDFHAAYNNWDAVEPVSYYSIYLTPYYISSP